MTMSKRTLALVFFLGLLAVFLYAQGNYQKKTQRMVPDIASFEECAAAGYPVMESYPEQCRTPDGRTFTRVTADIVPSPAVLTGVYVCLPKKDTGGPVTMECAFGLQTNKGYYALDLSAIESGNYPALTGNETITVEGVLVPIEMISTDRWQIYRDLVGIMSVEKITVNAKP